MFGVQTRCIALPLSQYIQWRYAIGEDRESLTKVSRVATDADQKSLDAVHGESSCRCSNVAVASPLMLPAQYAQH